MSLDISDLAFSWHGRAPFHMSVPHLAIAAGERAVLLGASGSGKSTLLSLICGILAPERGRIVIAGQELTGLRSHARDRFRAERIGVIFQQFNLLPFATPLENILLPLSFAPERRRRLASPRDAALSLARALDLPEQAVCHAPAAELSVGQQQRVAVARALIGSPDVIIADEPTSALDADAQANFLDLLFDQTAAAGATLLMVTHDPRLTERFDRVIRLDEIAQISRRAAA